MLPAADLDRLRGALEPVSLAIKQVVFDRETRIEHVYFVERGVVSVVSFLRDGSAIETAPVGREGMVGISVFLGAMTTPLQAFVQIPGHALRLPSTVLREEVHRGGALSVLLGRYTHALFSFLAQSLACNGRHPVRARAARFLLLTLDRVEDPTFPLTHLFLSQMLGVRRATVTEVMRQFQDAGCLAYSRGVVSIRDRAALERESCECYAIIRREMARSIDGTEIPDPLGGLKSSENGMTTSRAPSDAPDAEPQGNR